MRLRMGMGTWWAMGSCCCGFWLRSEARSTKHWNPLFQQYWLIICSIKWSYEREFLLRPLGHLAMSDFMKVGRYLK
jgi:hypothetical protein